MQSAPNHNLNSITPRAGDSLRRYFGASKDVIKISDTVRRL